MTSYISSISQCFISKSINGLLLLPVSFHFYASKLTWVCYIILHHFWLELVFWLILLATDKLQSIFLSVLSCLSALSGRVKTSNYVITWKHLIHQDSALTGVTGLSKMLTLCFYGNKTTHWSYCHTRRQELL